MQTVSVSCSCCRQSQSAASAADEFQSAAYAADNLSQLLLRLLLLQSTCSYSSIKFLACYLDYILLHSFPPFVYLLSVCVFSHALSSYSSTPLFLSYPPGPSTLFLPPPVSAYPVASHHSVQLISIMISRFRSCCTSSNVFNNHRPARNIQP